MLLVLAILALLATVAVEILTVLANMMSDAPGEQMSYWPTLVIGLGLTAALFAGWWFRV